MTSMWFMFALAWIFQAFSPIPYLGFVVVFGLGLRRKYLNKGFLLFLILLSVFRLEFKLPQLGSDQGRIVKLYNQSVLVQSATHKVLIVKLDPNQFSLGDKLMYENEETLSSSRSFYGFDGEGWAVANGITSMATYKATLTESSGFLEWISYESTESNEFQSLYRQLIFQIQDENGLGFLISLGIVFQLIFEGFEMLMVKLCKKGTKVVLSLIFLILGVVLGWPLALIRVGVFSFTKQFNLNRRLRWSLNVVLLGMWVPEGLSQLVWLLPLSLELGSIFGPKTHQTLTKYGISSMLFHAFNIRFGFFMPVIYLYLRKGYRWLLMGVLMARLVPPIQPLFIQLVQIINALIVWIDGFWVQTGRLHLISFLLMMIWFHWAQKLESKRWLIGLFISLWLLNPVLLLPWFDQVSFINIGQGDALLIQTAFNRNVVMVDTGPQSGYRNLQAYLDGIGVHKIDALIITHQDADHSSNQAKLVNDYHIKALITQPQNLSFSNLYLRNLEVNQSSSENDASLVYVFKLQDLSFLFSADISSLAEKSIIKEYPNLRVDVLKVAHHGSSSSTSNDFLHQIQAQLAIISVGNNTYGHPHFSVLSRLKGYHVETLSTFEEGDIRFILIPDFPILQTSSKRIIRLDALD